MNTSAANQVTIWANSSGFSADPAKIHIRNYNQNDANRVAYVTIQYTKTTD